MLIGRTHAPDSRGFSRRDAVVSAIVDLPIPVVLDVDCGHGVPHLAPVNGALARVTLTADAQRIEQSFV